MKVKICVNNVDLHVQPRKENDYIDQLLKEFKNTICNEYELEEHHCLGYCYWCQLGPMALVNDHFVVKKD
jgi:uncharacterized protein YuzB (UPF0349 family)